MAKEFCFYVGFFLHQAVDIRMGDVFAGALGRGQPYLLMKLDIPMLDIECLCE